MPQDGTPHPGEQHQWESDPATATTSIGLPDLGDAPVGEHQLDEDNRAAVNALLDHSPEQVLLDGAPHPVVGDSPWGVPRPFVLDMAAAGRELGYRAPATYAQALPATVQWLVAALAGRDWREAFPYFLRVYGEQSFDYAQEDAWLAEQGSGALR